MDREAAAERKRNRTERLQKIRKTIEKRTSERAKEQEREKCHTNRKEKEDAAIGNGQK